MEIFPVDDIALDLIEHSLRGALKYNEETEQFDLVGAEFSFNKLLDFYSGYDETKTIPLRDEDGYEIPNWVEYTDGPLYHYTDVIRALIAEVRRLRVNCQ